MVPADLEAAQVDVPSPPQIPRARRPVTTGLHGLKGLLRMALALIGKLGRRTRSQFDVSTTVRAVEKPTTVPKIIVRVV